MAPILGFTVGAAGVETESTLDLAIGMSLHKLQGFLLGPGVISDDVDAIPVAQHYGDAGQREAGTAMMG